MVKTVTKRNVTTAQFPSFLYPSIKVLPVAEAYLGPASKKGYLRMLPIKTATIKAKP